MDVRRQRARPAVQAVEWELEFKRRLAEKILEKCNSDEFTVLVPGGRRKSSGKIIMLGNVVISKKILRTRKIMVMHSNERGE